MKNEKYVEIPYSPNAVLRINRNNIIATISSTDSSHIDIYTANTPIPFHVPSEYGSKNVLNDIWDEMEGNN